MRNADLKELDRRRRSDADNVSADFIRQRGIQHLVSPPLMGGD